MIRVRVEHLDHALAADTFASQILEIVAAPFEDANAINAARLRVDTMKWLSSKLKPRAWGDRVQAQLTGADGGAIKVQSVPVTPNEIAPEVREALRAALIASTAGGSDDGNEG